MKSVLSCDIISAVIQKEAAGTEVLFLFRHLNLLRCYEGVVFPEGITAPFCLSSAKKKGLLMKKQNPVFNLSLAAMFLAMAFVLPFFTGQIPQIGKMLCPMHFPVILCGYVCGGPWGLVVGFAAPLLRSVIFGMPTLFPKAFAMAFELACYGFMSGLLYRVLPKNKLNLYVSLVLSMITGRLVWGAVQFCCIGLDPTRFGFSAFWAGAVADAVPGIIIQLVLIPLIIALLEKAKLMK